MMAASAVMHELSRCDGYQVESADGSIGWVEEVWLGLSDEPRALAVRTTDGRRALLEADEVVSIVAENDWVVVRPGATLLELDAPRVEATGDGYDRHLTAAWATTGSVIAPPARQGLFRRRARRFGSRRVAEPSVPGPRAERPVWQVILLLYTGLVLAIATEIALAFTVARLVTGDAY